MSPWAILWVASLLAVAPWAGADEEKKAEAPVFLLKDGSRISGTFEAKEVRVETAYGVLTVPVADVHKVTFGKVSDPELAGRIRGLIETLGDSSFDVREEAMEGLRELGWVAEPELQGAKEHDDPEVKQRAAKILEELAEEGLPLEEGGIVPEEDTIVTDRFTIRGKLLVDSFEVQTGFGTLHFGKKDIRILYVRPPRETAVEAKIPGTATLNRGLIDTEVKVLPGAFLTLSASGTIVIQNWGGETTPEGGPQWGRFNNQFQSGALIGRIGKGGPLFLVGRHYSGVASRGGTLFLGLALNDSGQNTGEFRVRIRMRPRD